MTISCTQTRACRCQVLQRMQISCHLKSRLTRMDLKTQRPKSSLMSPKIYYIPEAWGQQARWLGLKAIGYGVQPSCRAAESVLALNARLFTC